LQTNVAAGNLQTCMDLVKQVKPKYSLAWYFAPRLAECRLPQTKLRFSPSSLAAKGLDTVGRQFVESHGHQWRHQ